MSTRIPLAAALAATAALLVGPPAPPAHAGPTVISDEMLRDTRVTPVLGRGYSISTNTFQSICLTGIAKTKPSYNFDYTFDDLSEDMVQVGAKGSSTSVSAKPGWLFGGLLRMYGVSGGMTMNYTDKVTKEEHHKHNILVSVAIDAYYSSIDEAASKMADAPSELLRDEDIPGFFDACGMYYVRSISRQGALYAVFTYETSTTERDVDFELTLEAAVRNWAVDITTKSTVFNKTKTTLDNKRLTIHTMGFGLGKDENATLISYDLDTFKSAIKDAFKAMQSDDTGMVSAIEVVPWVENPEFQRLLKLKPKTVEEKDFIGLPVKDDKGNPVTKTYLPYEQKRILTENSEFLAEIDRTARAKLNVYYKSKQCKQQINLDYMSTDGQGNWKFMPGNDSVILENNRQSATMGQKAETMTVGQLYNDQLSDAHTSLIYLEYDSFMYGGKEAPSGLAEDDASARERAKQAYQLGKYPKDLFPGAISCVDDLVGDGFTTRSYRMIPSCRRIEEQMVVVAGRVIDDFCMPNQQGTAETAQEKAQQQIQQEPNKP